MVQKDISGALPDPELPTHPHAHAMCSDTARHALQASEAAAYSARAASLTAAGSLALALAVAFASWRR